MSEQPDRRKRITGRRELDTLFDSRIAQIEELIRALGPAVQQVARIDDAVDDLEKWIHDERKARRQHFSDLLETVREIRAAFVKHQDDTDAEIAELRKEVRGLRIEQINGRRVLIGSMFGSVLLLVGALASAVAVVVSSGPT